MKPWIGLILWLFFVVPAWGGERGDSCSPRNLVRLTESELLEVYGRGAAVCPPAGFVRGYPIIRPGRCLTAARSRATRLLWQGKEFAPDGQSLVNRVAGMRLVRAEVYLAASWWDGQPSLVLDYQQTSRLFREVRDEVREVSPGVYLGLTYLRNSQSSSEAKPALFFVLDAHPR